MNLRQLAFNLAIFALAVPIDLVFLILSTVRLTRAGFGLVEAFKYSLQR